MTDEEFRRFCASIRPADKDAQTKAVARIDDLAKPPGSLGELENIAARLAGVTGQVHNTLDKRRVLVFAADNGVVEEGVASCPQSITVLQTVNMIAGHSGVAVLAKQYGAEVCVFDVGIAQELPCKGLRQCKIRCSTGNIAKGPAMTREEALRALSIGIEAAKEARADGVRVLGIGEMGIGNTSTSSAVLCALLGLSGDAVAETVGRGAGLVDEAFQKKIRVIGKALEVNQPDSKDVVDVLCKVGGLDIAAMTGAFLGAAACRLPVVIDGFISVVAALCAMTAAPAAVDAMFASHASHERGYRLAIDKLGLKACLGLDMRLGEGSGCPIMFSVMDGACAMMNNMTTFAQASMQTDFFNDISKERSY